MNPLLDQEFLLKLDSQSIKNIFARITTLNWDESPIERIEGKIQTGSVSIDGNSSMRRTCSLTMIVTDPSDVIMDWALDTKFKLDIGVLNEIDERYDPIIWFQQGIFIFTILRLLTWMKMPAITVIRFAPCVPKNELFYYAVSSN